MIIPARRLMAFVPPNVSRETVEACRVTVRFDLGLGLCRYRVVLPDGRERSGGCSSEPMAIEQAAWELADMLGAWAVAS